MDKGTCFVIMGYGVKTDYTTGRVLDLDKTYKNVIKPSAEEAGLKCVRADDLRHAGIIDVSMYLHILNSDVVIADLSTYNPNTLYELGIRHALRPRTTIAISEKELKYPFDVDHVVIRKYEHLGSDIGYDEVLRFRKELVETITTVLEHPGTDSPVYTYLKIRPPELIGDDRTGTTTSQHEQESLSTIIQKANEALTQNNFVTARSILEVARQIDPHNAYVVQRLVLATYKSKLPNHEIALRDALTTLRSLEPDTTTDPETLGLAGAIHKRLWEETESLENLSKAINFYGRGFVIKGDYYNGINLAYLLNVRGALSTGYQAIADFVQAERVRHEVITICTDLMTSDFHSRTDRYWIAATMEEAYYGIGNTKKYEEFRAEAEQMSVDNWERETTNDQIKELAKLLENSPLV